MKDDEIAVEYDPKKNPHNYTVDGAPLRDMTAAEWKALPEQVRRSVAAAEFYEVVKKSQPAEKKAAKEGK